MQYLDKQAKRSLCHAVDDQVKELEHYLVGTLGSSGCLYDIYESMCIDCFASQMTDDDFREKLEYYETLGYPPLSKAICKYTDTAAMLWWAAGAIYEGKDDSEESPDSPINYLFALMDQAATLKGIIKALADNVVARKSQSQIAAKARWEKDPRTEEKAFVKECWTDWQTNPSRYKSKASFLRDMHQKLENLELTASTLNEWIKLWKS